MRGIVVIAGAFALAACGQAGPAPDAAPAGGGGSTAAPPASTSSTASGVSYDKVQSIFSSSCVGCHPGINASLDLTPEKSYAQLVGVRAVEDTTLARVVAGDPDRSFLFIKINGREGLEHHDPGIGGRMPQGQGPLPQAQIDLLRQWIEEGAKGPDGTTKSADEVPTPGSLAAVTGEPATSPDGTGTITGTVTDDKHQPIEGAIVTELLVGADQPQGEEHYKAAFTDKDGKFTLAKAATGRLLVKAYAPHKIYTSYILTVPENGTATAAIGLATDALETPTIANPKVESSGGQTTVSMDVQGNRLDKNYTLAVNVDSGRVVEVHAPSGEDAGTWSATVDGTFTGKWIFLAVDHGCNSSGFLEVDSPA